MLFVTSLAILLAAGPSVFGASLDENYQSLQDAVAKKDVAQIKTLAVQTSAQAREAIAVAEPTTNEEKTAWKQRVNFAKDVDSYSEYALFVTAIQAEPATTVDLLQTLEKQNPKSKYLADAYATYFYALHKTGASAKIPEVAEKALTNFPDNADALAIMAEESYSKKQMDRALNYASRLTASLNKSAKPEGVSAGDWERKRGAGLASGYWIAGVVQAEKKQYFEADRDLRAALPLVSGNETRKAYALFYLGLANYNLGKMTMKKAQILEAVKFSQDAASIKSPLAQQAWHNALAMKDEAAKMR